jgi:hypothetical protein
MKMITGGGGRETTEISVEGRFLTVPAIKLDTVTVAITGRLVRKGFSAGEGVADPRQVGAPESLVEMLRQRKAPLDIFVFHQRLPEVQPRHGYPHEWENVAAIPLTTFDAWWEGRASQVTRKNVRRSVKRGVEVRRVDFDDRLIEAIVCINNEMPLERIVLTFRKGSMRSRRIIRPISTQRVHRRFPRRKVDRVPPVIDQAMWQRHAAAEPEQALDKRLSTP